MKEGNFDKDESEKFFSSSEYKEYYKSVYSGELSTVYTLNKNFLEDLKKDENNSTNTSAPLGGCYLYSELDKSISKKIEREHFG